MGLAKRGVEEEEEGMVRGGGVGLRREEEGKRRPKDRYGKSMEHKHKPVKE